MIKSSPHNKLLKKGDLPNSVGFKFMALLSDGSVKEDEVKKRDNGTHYCETFSDMIGWFRFIQTAK